VFDEEYRIVARDGRVVCVRDVALVVRDEEGTPVLAGVLPRHHQTVPVDLAALSSEIVDRCELLEGRQIELDVQPVTAAVDAPGIESRTTA
jgi:hypothetical protein